MNFYKIGEFAKKVGKSTSTIREWDRLGLLKPHHTGQGNYRYYSEEQLDLVLSGRFSKKENEKNIIFYCYGKSENEIREKTSHVLNELIGEYSAFQIIKDVDTYINLGKIVSYILKNKIDILMIYDRKDISEDTKIILDEICLLNNCIVKYIIEV